MNPGLKILISGAVFIIFCVAIYVFIKYKSDRIFTVKDAIVLTSVFFLIGVLDYSAFYYFPVYAGVCIAIGILGTILMVSDTYTQKTFDKIILDSIGTMIGFTIACPLILPLVICVGHFKLDKKQ